MHTHWHPRFLLLILISLALGLVIGVRPVAAHPSDEYYLLHEIKLSTTEIQLEYYLFPGPLVAAALWEEADTDSDNTISSAESTAFAQTLLPQLHLKVGDQELPWSIVAAEFPASVQPLIIGNEGVWMRLQAPWPPTAVGPQTLTLTNESYTATGRYWFDLIAAEGISFQDPQIDANQFMVALELPIQAPHEPSEAPGNQTQANLAPEATAVGASLSEQAGEVNTTPIGREQSPWLQQLDALLRTPTLTPQFYVSALLIALVLGALHALTPGHGKTLVAAYLVGARGTIGHAAFLGGVVTLTHTGSVIAMGGLALLASHAIVPGRLGPLLELASGLLIVALGLNLFWNRLRPDSDAHHHHHGPHGHAPAAFRAPPASEHGAGIRWPSLLTLGVSGGLVPCPDAIAILMVAVALQRIALGLALILAFSAGLAGVLIGIGVALVTSKAFVTRRFALLDRVGPWLPLTSAIVVTALGVVMVARAVSSWVG